MMGSPPAGNWVCLSNRPRGRPSNRPRGRPASPATVPLYPIRNPLSKNWVCFAECAPRPTLLRPCPRRRRHELGLFGAIASLRGGIAKACPEPANGASGLDDGLACPSAGNWLCFAPQACLTRRFPDAPGHPSLALFRTFASRSPASARLALPGIGFVCTTSHGPRPRPRRANWLCFVHLHPVPLSPSLPA
jgi:hypothetical protein